jgi:zinc-binding alcohol dehydrogenase/oxidoreductase
MSLTALPERVDGVHEMAVKPCDVPTVRDGSDDVLVELSHAALNRRDHWIRRELYPAVVFPWVLGADGCGTVTAVGNQACSHLIGKRVVLNAAVHFGTPAFHILGSFPAPGTFASHIVLPASQVHEAPKHLTNAEAAALPLAGLTAFRAVFTAGRVQRGDVVLVSGIGGGVAVFAMQFAVAVGATVFVTSSSAAKIERAKAMGAAGGVLYSDPEWPAQLGALCPDARIDVVIDGSGGDSINQYVRLLAPGGRIVTYGATNGRVKSFDITRLFLKSASIVGVTMGSPAEFELLLSFVRAYEIACRRRVVIAHVLPSRVCRRLRLTS